MTDLEKAKKIIENQRKTIRFLFEKVTNVSLDAAEQIIQLDEKSQEILEINETKAKKPEPESKPETKTEKEKPKEVPEEKAKEEKPKKPSGLAI